MIQSERSMAKRRFIAMAGLAGLLIGFGVYRVTHFPAAVLAGVVIAVLVAIPIGAYFNRF